MIKMRKTHLALLVALLLVDATLQSDKRKRQINVCPEGWKYVPHLQRCYGFSRSTATWVHAALLCHSSGGMLIEPKSEDQMHAIVEHMRSNVTGAVWTGGYSIDTNNEWKWLDNNADIGLYQPWSPANLVPDFHPNEHCLEIRPDDDYLWNDINCNTNNRVACEISLSGNNDDTDWM